jgi:hypothetical protein
MAYQPIPSKAEAVSVAGTAVGLTLANVANATKAEVDVHLAPIRFYTDGSTPTASAGRRAGRNATITLRLGEIERFKAIRETGVSAALSVVYYMGEPGPGE